MSRNSVAFFWKSSPPAHRGETKAQGPSFPGLLRFFSFFFLVSISPIRFFTVSHRRSLCRGEVGNPQFHRLRDITLHRKETNMTSLVCMLASEEPSTSEQVNMFLVVCLNQVFLQMSFCSEHGLFLPQDTANFL